MMVAKGAYSMDTLLIPDISEIAANKNVITKI